MHHCRLKTDLAHFNFKKRFEGVWGIHEIDRLRKLPGDVPSQKLTIFGRHVMRNKNKYVERKLKPRGKMEGKASREYDESCIFCHFAHNRDEETTILKQDEEFVCFRDIDPVAPHHYLVIPRDHIVSCKSLNRTHIDLVKRMAKFGKEVLLDQGVTDMENVRLGFHQPPFISVEHLHLHVLAPASQISMQYKFTPETDRFITERSLRERLKKVSPLTFASFRKHLGF